MTRVRIRDLARVEIIEAAEHYEAERAGLGSEFRLAVEQAIDQISESPKLFARYEGCRTRHEYRRVVLKRFPYVIIYHIGSNDIVVVAVTHGARKPGYWERR